MMARAASRADELRAHGEAFRLSLELGCTPKQAADQLRILRAKEASAASQARMQAKMGAAPASMRSEPADLVDLPDEPWMMRN